MSLAPGLNRVFIAGGEAKARKIVEQLMGKRPTLVCTIGSTKTAYIPGITVAGEKPELVKYTPPADVELIYYGRCRCIEGVPATPDGKPTPALITMSAVEAAGIPFFAVDAGCEVKPSAPYVSLGGTPGEDIRLGWALERKTVEEIVERGKVLGNHLAGLCDYLLLGESIPGGTTTALGVLMALGIDARGKVSSSMPKNPHQLKVRVVEEGMKAAGITVGSLRDEPLAAVSALGDPVIAAIVGMALGAGPRAPVILAGGTQMACAAAVIGRIDPGTLEAVAIGTTKYIIEDESSDIRWIVKRVGDLPIIAADPGIHQSVKPGLRAYGDGFVKEGVGAGGACLAAMLKSKGAITTDILWSTVERHYELKIEAHLGQRV